MAVISSNRKFSRAVFAGRGHVADVHRAVVIESSVHGALQLQDAVVLKLLDEQHASRVDRDKSAGCALEEASLARTWCLNEPTICRSKDSVDRNSTSVVEIDVA